MMRGFALAAFLSVTSSSMAAAQRDTAFTWSRRLPAGARLSIRNLNGPIDVRSSSSDRVEVRATLRVQSRGNASDVTFDVRELAPDNVEICTVYRGRSDCDPRAKEGWSGDGIRVTVRYTVEIPKGLRLRPVTGNGDISVAQSAAEIDASTGNGDVLIRDAAGKVNANTGNGDIDVRISGPIRDAESMLFSTGNGAVRLTLPSDFNGEIDANSGTGAIQSDFELRIQGRLNASRVHGVIGNGKGPLIRLRTGNGRIELRKA
jgi:hypothetical protein